MSELNFPAHDMMAAPTDQAWFWGADWQQGEQQAGAEIADGLTEQFADVESMFSALASEP